jgi:Protein of unknown function (DUF2971)
MSEHQVLLNHYTDYAGLLGICRTGELWCTSIRHLNDRSEYHYVHEMAHQELTKATEQSSGELRRKLEGIAFTHPPVSDPAVAMRAREMQASGSHFVFSLSTETNDLSQWRAYGAQGIGVEIRFSKVELERLAKPNGFVLVECEYGETVLRERLSALIKDASARLEAIAGTGSYPDGAPMPEIRAVAEFFWEQIIEIAPRFKHPKFWAEKEWRLVFKPLWRTRVVSEVQFRIRRGHIVPYLPFKLSVAPPEEFMGYTALRHIRLGPGADVPLEAAIVLQVLHLHHCPHAGVTSSGIPLDSR